MMHRILIVIAVLLVPSLGACGREPARSALAPPSAAASRSVASAGTAAQGSEATREAAAVQETPGEAGQEEPGTASLERLAALPPEQQLPAGRWKPGVNYDAIAPAQPTNAPPGKVQVMEIFWLGCPHCYALEPSVLSWLKSKPDYVSFVRVPVMWGPVHRAHARLFYTLEALGRDDLVEKAFEEIHAYAQDTEAGRSDLVHADHSPLVGSSDEATLAAQLAFAKANGIDPDAFRKAYDSPVVQSNLQYAQEVTNRYQVGGVPLIIVDGKYSTDVGKAGSANELFQLVDSLTAAEHRKAQHG